MIADPIQGHGALAFEDDARPSGVERGPAGGGAFGHRVEKQPIDVEIANHAGQGL